jgi:hypothetical protein
MSVESRATRRLNAGRSQTDTIHNRDGRSNATDPRGGRRWRRCTVRTRCGCHFASFHGSGCLLRTGTRPDPGGGHLRRRLRIHRHWRRSRTRALLGGRRPSRRHNVCALVCTRPDRAGRRAATCSALLPSSRRFAHAASPRSLSPAVPAKSSLSARKTRTSATRATAALSSSSFQRAELGVSVLRRLRKPAGPLVGGFSFVCFPRRSGRWPNRPGWSTLAR